MSAARGRTGRRREKWRGGKGKTKSEEMGEEQNGGIVDGEGVENSPIIKADARARSENSSEEGKESQRSSEKKAVIGGVWCLSNTES